MKVEIFGKPWCPYCDAAKALADMSNCDFIYKTLNEDFSRETFFEIFPNARTFPQIIVDGDKIGGYTEFKMLLDSISE